MGVWMIAACAVVAGCEGEGAATGAGEPPEELSEYFSPPPELEDDFGEYRSPLLFESGESVEDAEGWAARREEILEKWHEVMGAWPEVLEDPEVTVHETTEREGIIQHSVEVEVAPGWTREAYLLIPEEEAPLPAALVVFYDPETGIGQSENPYRDFAWQLARRGFVTLSLGSDYDTNYYPEEDAAALQPLSMLAYMAANSYHALANLEETAPDRIGIVGHSYGGKWAMFASSLYDKFALGVWSDGGIVFDETRENVNYWDPWYLGYEQDTWQERGWDGVPTEENPRAGAYKEMIREGMDLHELHALMAPRPFLVSGGSEDPPERWRALNHTVEVNRLLGHENRVAMHNRPDHSPNEESNEIVYQFFEHFLK